MTATDIFGQRSQADLLGEVLYRRSNPSMRPLWDDMQGGRREFWRERARRVMAGDEAFPVIPEGRKETLGG